MSDRLAILVDGDNISATHADDILKTAQQNCRADVVRVYLNAQINSGWLNAPGYRVIHAGVGKNAADVLLSIEAIELALAGEFTDFVIASSDGDFTHLALRLREWGVNVVGMGEAKAPESFRAACSRFAEIKAPACKITVSVNQSLIARQAAGEPISVKAKGSGPEVTNLDLNIRAIIKKHSTNGNGITIAALGQKMRQAHDFKIKESNEVKEGTWRKYFEVRPELYKLVSNGSEISVRFLPQGFSST